MLRASLLGLCLSVSLFGAACHSSSSHDDAAMPVDGGDLGAGNVDAGGDGPSTAAWKAARIQSPIPYVSPEHVDEYASSFSTPQIIAGSGQVVYPSGYSDGSWQIVVQSLDGSAKKTLLTSASEPGLLFTAMLSVPEVHGVLVLLKGAQDLIVGRLLFVPLDGSAPVTIDTDVQTAQVSADGTRVNYVAMAPTAAAPSLIKTSKILSPAPQQLGALDVGSDFAYAANPISRSGSSATNTPFFYLVTGPEPSTNNNHAKPFGTVPAGAPMSIITFLDDTAVGDFASVTASQNGRFVSPRYSTWVDIQSSTPQTGTLVFSPDFTRFAVVGTGSVTLYKQDGTSQVVAAPTVSSVIWSGDSTLVAALSESGSPDCTFGIITVATGAIASHTSTGCVLSSQYAIGFTADDASLIVRDSTYEAYKLSTVEAETGTAHVLSQGTSNDVNGDLTPDVAGGTAAFADTGDGLVFCDDWAAIYAHYDGSGRTRLDTPRTGEVTLDATHQIADNEAGVTGLFAWDATSHRVLFEPVVEANAALSVLEPIHTLVSAPLSAGGATVLLDGTKTTGQIEGFEENFHIDETYGRVLFNSANGAIAYDIMPATLSVGALAGGNAVQLSPTLPPSPGALFGPGTMYSVGRIYGAAGVPEGVLYDYYVPNDLIERAVAMDGTIQSAFAGKRFRGYSPDGKLAFLSDGASPGYMLSLPVGATSQPVLVTATLALQGVGGCGICNGTTSLWTHTDGEVTFTADDKLLLVASPSGGGPTSTYFVDPSAATSTPTDLAVTNLSLLSDGLTAVANASDGSIVTFTVANPAQKTTYPIGTIAAAAGDGSYLAYTTSSAKTLSSVHTTDMSVTNLLPTSLPAGGQVFSVSQSTDGKRLSFGYYTHMTPAPNDACNGYKTTSVLEGIDGTSPTLCALPCGSSGQGVPSGDFSSLLYVSNGALYAVSGTSPAVMISAANEKVADFRVAPNSNRVFVRALTAAQQWLYYSVHADGTMRTTLGSPLPVQKQLYDLQFYKNGTALVLDSDAVTDGVLELFRFDLP